MKRDKFDRTHILLYLCGILPVVWIALLIAPALSEGLVGFLNHADTILANPLHVEICEDSLRTVLIFLGAYAMGLTVFLSNDKNYRRREEHGSAKWGNPEQVDRKYSNRKTRQEN